MSWVNAKFLDWGRAFFSSISKGKGFTDKQCWKAEEAPQAPPHVRQQENRLNCLNDIKSPPEENKNNPSKNKELCCMGVVS